MCRPMTGVERGGVPLAEGASAPSGALKVGRDGAVGRSVRVQVPVPVQSPDQSVEGVAAGEAAV